MRHLCPVGRVERNGLSPYSKTPASPGARAATGAATSDYAHTAAPAASAEAGTAAGAYRGGGLQDQDTRAAEQRKAAWRCVLRLRRHRSDRRSACGAPEERRLDEEVDDHQGDGRGARRFT